jgi:hypothetical protein
MTDFDDPELIEVEVAMSSDRLNVGRGDSTPETRARWAKLKSKKEGTSWQEGDRLYRIGPRGVTVINLSRWS